MEGRVNPNVIDVSTPTFSNHHPISQLPSTLRQEPPSKNYDSLKAQMMVSIFSAIKYFSLKYVHCSLDNYIIEFELFKFNEPLNHYLMLLYCTLNRLQYSVNITSICTGKPKHLCDSLYCDISFNVVVLS